MSKPEYSTVRAAHRCAMESAELADLHHMRGFSYLAYVYRLVAYASERAAADLLADYPANDLTRSILHRSAAWLAIQAGSPVEAISLALRGLAGGAHPAIVAELEEVLAEALKASRTCTS